MDGHTIIAIAPSAESALAQFDETLESVTYRYFYHYGYYTGRPEAQTWNTTNNLFEITHKRYKEILSLEKDIIAKQGVGHHFPVRYRKVPSNKLIVWAQRTAKGSLLIRKPREDGPKCSPCSMAVSHFDGRGDKGMTWGPVMTDDYSIRYEWRKAVNNPSYDAYWTDKHLVRP